MLQLGAKAFPTLFLPAALLSLPACQLDHPFVHERFAELQPARVAVPPVVNRTLRDLSHVSTAGVLQRVFGSAEVDVLAAFEDALRDGLMSRGYEVVEPGASRPPAGRDGGGAGVSDAVLECEVNEFAIQSASSGGAMDISGEVALVRLAGPGTREVIFRRIFHHSSGKGTTGTRSAFAFDAEIRRAGTGSLEGLPPRTAPGAPAAPAR